MSLVVGVGLSSGAEAEQLCELTGALLRQHGLDPRDVTTVATLDSRAQASGGAGAGDRDECRGHGLPVPAPGGAGRAAPQRRRALRGRDRERGRGGGPGRGSHARRAEDGPRPVHGRGGCERVSRQRATRRPGGPPMTGMTVSSLLSHHGDDEVGPGLSDFAVNVAVPSPPGWLRSALTDGPGRRGGLPGPACGGRGRRHGPPVRAGLGAHDQRGGGGVHPRRPSAPLGRAGGGPPAVHRAGGGAAGAGPPSRPRRCCCRATASGCDPAAVPAGADLVVIGNPTNPTSRLHRRDDIRALLRPGRVVVVDEAFMDLTPGEEESLAQEAAVTPGLVVIRSLTKTFGLAGVRAGYVLAAPGQIRELAAHQPHWSVNTLALVAATTCLGPAGVRHRARVAEAAHRQHQPPRSGPVRSGARAGSRPCRAVRPRPAPLRCAAAGAAAGAWLRGTSR